MNSLQVLEQASLQALQGVETVNYYGFPKTRPKQADRRVETLIQERLEVSNRAQQMGFTPLAIVPVKFLHAAFKKFGLYWFEDIDEQGKVAVNLTPELPLYAKFMSPEHESVTKFIFLLIFALYITLTIFAVMISGPTLIARIFYQNPYAGLSPVNIRIGHFVDNWALYNFVPAMFLLWEMHLLGGDLSEIKLKQLYLYRKIFFFPKKHLFKLLFTGERGPARLTLYFNISSNIFAHDLNLMRQNNLQPCIAAVPQAFNISRTELQQVIDKERARLAEEERRRKELEADPILYYRDGNYAVVVAQYGDFVSEKRLLKWAKKQGLSLWLN